MANPIVVVDYDSGWPERFRFLRARIADALQGVATAIEHVGSTAVPGLAAKPVIDIDVLLASADLLPAAIERLARVGYSYQGDLGVAGREAFRAPANDASHHLYVCPPSSSEFRRHVAFRDYLREHPNEAKAYSDLKKKLALQFRDDRLAYSAGKTGFVVELTNRAIAGQAS